MQINQLTTFLKASELLSFSKTAEVLGYSQAAITIQIKQLEEEFQVKLFDRISKKVFLTGEGIQFQKYASHILDTINEAHIALRESSVLNGNLRIGASESLCTYILPPILAQYHELYPDVSLSLKTGNASALLDMLKQNQVDIVYLFAEKAELTEYKLLFDKPEPFVFLTSFNHPLCKCSHLSIRSLENQSFLLTEPGCNYRKLLEHLFLANNMHLHSLLEIGNTEAIKRFCAQGLGVALLPYFTVADECAKKELHPLDVSPLNICLYHQLICHKQKHLITTIEQFIKLYISAFSSAETSM